MQAVSSVNGKVLWANLHLLFWLSLLPFAAGWMGENHFESVPVALYGFILLMCGVAYTIFMFSLVRHHGQDSAIARAFGSDRKGKISVLLYPIGIALSFVNPWLGFATYLVVAAMWFIPDRRMEQAMADK